MASAEDVSAAQSFFNSTDDHTVNSDSILKLFKRAEIDGTMAAASTGKFHDFWTVERVGDLNNTVDATPNCPADLKALFGPNAGKNARLKATKIGNLVLNRMIELMKSNGAGGSGAAASAPAAPVPASLAPPAASSTSAASLGSPRSHSNPAEPMRMQRYVFAPGLPHDCRLRVRSAPQTESEELGVVTPEDEIYATAQQGDWIRVHLAEGGGKEAWMLVATANQLLLVPSDEPLVVASSFEQQPQPFQQPPPRLAMSVMPQQYQPAQSMSFPVQQSLSNLSMSQNFGQYAGMGGMPGAQNFNDTARSLGGDGSGSEVVSYAAFKQMERRVSMLEAELNHLKALLRSV